MKRLLKNSSQLDFDCFISKIPSETITSLFYCVSSNKNTKTVGFWCVNVILNVCWGVKNLDLNKIWPKMNKMMPNITCAFIILNLDNYSKKDEFQNIFSFQILCWTNFLMIALTFLYDEYCDRPKLTFKSPFEYIIPPPPATGSEELSRNKRIKEIP